MEILLTRSDGHGVASDMDGAERVIILSGAGDGQLVPQGARTVEVCKMLMTGFLAISLPLNKHTRATYLGGDADSRESESYQVELHDRE